MPELIDRLILARGSTEGDPELRLTKCVFCKAPTPRVLVMKDPSNEVALRMARICDACFLRFAIDVIQARRIVSSTGKIPCQPCVSRLQPIVTPGRGELERTHATRADKCGCCQTPTTWVIAARRPGALAWTFQAICEGCFIRIVTELGELCVECARAIKIHSAASIS